jgi:hypothetical protein
MRILTILFAGIALAACFPMADGAARIRGHLQTYDEFVPQCQLMLLHAETNVVVGDAHSIGGSFEETFVIAPREDDYYVAIECEGSELSYRSAALRLGSVEAYREGVDLGVVYLEPRSSALPSRDR